MRLILPVAGQSSRYPGLRPKWMLNHPNGNLIIAESIRGWDLSDIEEIVVVCLRQHDEKYGAQAMLHKQFAKLGLVGKLHVVVIEQSNSQPHTVYQALKLASISGPILIKDSDNYFFHTPKAGNTVCYATIADINRGNVINKSYILMNEAGTVLNIVEKRMISDTFCVGGYGFGEAADFVSTFEDMVDIPNLYVSHVIYQMILNGKYFSGSKVSGFVDWGTIKDWNAFRSHYCTLFVDLDGVLVENSAEYFSPFWGETDEIKENVDVINRLYDSGYGEIIITTTRGADSEEVTRQQLERIGLKYHRILFGLLHAKRVVINDYSKSNPYRSCDSINVSRNAPQLAEMLQNLVSMPEDNTGVIVTMSRE